MNDNYNIFFENKQTKFKLEIESMKAHHETITGTRRTEIGSLMDVMRQRNKSRRES